MPLDTSIPLNFSVPQFNVAPAQVGGPTNMLTDVMKLKGLQQEQQLNQLKFQEYQRARGEAATKLAEEKANKQALMNALRGASVGANGPQLPDMTSAANALIGQGKLAPALTALGASEAFTKDTRAKSDLAKVDAEVLDKNLGTFRTFASGVNSPEAAAIYARAMYDHPMLGPLMQQTGYDKESAAAKAAQDFAADPQRWMASHVGLTGEQVMKAIQPTQRTAAATVSAPAETPMPNPVTSAAFNAPGASPVQLAMLGGGAGAGVSPLIQMARPMPSEGGVTAPTRVAARTRRPTADEDGETPGAPINVGKVPDNYRRTASGGFEIIPGSPADPEVIRAKQEATTMGTKTAEARVKAQTSLPQVIDNAKVLEDGIAGLIGGSIIDAKGNVKYDKKAPPHPGFESAVGASLAKALPEWAVPYEGTDRAGFVERFKQVKSGAFMDAYNTLRGGGAITEKEGEKGTAALNRMSLATNEKEFIQAANEFRSIVQRGVQRAKEQAGQSGADRRPQTSGFTVVTPDNKTHIFPSQEALDNFKRAAGL